MQHRILTILVLISLGLSGYALLKHYRKNPEEIARLALEGMQRIQSREAKEEREKQTEAIKEKMADVHNVKDVPFAGNPEGDIVIVYFFDYRCGYCRRADSIVDELVKNDPKLKVIYKEFPIFDSSLGAEAALAAYKQGKYIPMHQAIMAHKEPLTKESVRAIAKKVGLCMGAFEKEMTEAWIKNAIQENLTLAETLGISGVPTFIVGTETVLPGVVSVDEFHLAIQKEREKLAGSTPDQKGLPQSDSEKSEQKNS